MIKFKSVQPKGAFAFGLDVPKLRLDYSGLVVVEGPNGVGKSSIMNSITQTVFGKNDTRGSADEICNVVLKEGCDITVEFEADGELWTAELARGFKRPGSNARVTDLFLFDAQGGDRRGESMADTLSKIGSKVRMDFEQFRATSYMGVQTVSKFLDGTDAERMKVITPFLGLSVWDRALARVRILKKEAMDKLLEAKGKFEFSSQSLADLEEELLTDEEKLARESRIEDIDAAIAETQSEIDRIKASTTSVDNRLRVLQSDLARAQNGVNAARKSITQVTVDRDRSLRLAATAMPQIDRTPVNQIEESLAAVTKEYHHRETHFKLDQSAWKTAQLGTGVTVEIDTLLSEAESIEEEMRPFEATVQATRAALERMPNGEMGECPTCFSNVTSDHLAQVRAEYTKKYDEAVVARQALITRRDAVVNQARSIFDKLKSDSLAQISSDFQAVVAWRDEQVKVLNEQLVVLTKGMETQVQAHRAEQARQVSSDFETKVAALNAEISNYEESRRSIQAEMDKLSLDPTTLGNRQKVATLETEIAKFREEKQAVQTELSNHELRVSQVDAIRKTCDESRALVATLEQRVDDLEFMDAHTGDQGIKRFKLRGCLGFMNDKLAHYMSLLELPMQVWFQDRVLKKKSLKKNPKLLTDEDFTDQFEIMVTDGPKEGVPIGMYSGGERTLIALSLLGVLWETANVSGQGGSNLLMIDEPFGLLREDNRDRALKLFEYWAGMGKCVVVSDNTGAIDGVGRRAATWKVRKEGHVSNVTVVEG